MTMTMTMTMSSKEAHALWSASFSYGSRFIHAKGLLNEKIYDFEHAIFIRMCRREDEPTYIGCDTLRCSAGDGVPG
jgi:hypothetical protein